MNEFGNDTFCQNCGKQLAGRDGFKWIALPYIKITAGHCRLVERKDNRWHYISSHGNPKAELIFCSGECLWDNFDKQKYLKEQYHKVYSATESNRVHSGVTEQVKGFWKKLLNLK